MRAISNPPRVELATSVPLLRRALTRSAGSRCPHCLQRTPENEREFNLLLSSCSGHNACVERSSLNARASLPDGCSFQWREKRRRGGDPFVSAQPPECGRHAGGHFELVAPATTL